MTRAQSFLVGSVAVAVVYVILMMGIVPTPEPFFSEILPVLPWWGLVTFGAYALASLGAGLFTLNDTVDAYKELVEDIKTAEKDLKAKGISI
ncbi:dolichol-phosphate mannosyltransferase subunit 3 [Dipodascopsis tothii]|uniref:dolichol-phosphate mannosyltransferase subunit 3 n=1 Tax=Dipodascopsis tothii TaxID=44089 RepID=UPI0034CE5272